MLKDFLTLLAILALLWGAAAFMCLWLIAREFSASIPDVLATLAALLKGESDA